MFPVYFPYYEKYAFSTKKIYFGCFKNGTTDW